MVPDYPRTKPSSYPPEISPYEPPSDPYFVSSDSPNGYPSISPVQYPTEMFQTVLHKTQMVFTVIAVGLNYAPADTLLHTESLKMLLQEADSAYPSDIPYSNEYLLESHALLVHQITGLLQDQ